MKIEDLKNKAKQIFVNAPNEDTLYCIEDGNFWYASKKLSADIYARKLGLKLIEIKKSDLEKEVKKPKTKPKTTKRIKPKTKK